MPQHTLLSKLTLILFSTCLHASLAWAEATGASTTAAAPTAPTAANPVVTGSANPISSASLLQTSMGLLFVLGLLMVLAWVLKRTGLSGALRSNQFYKVLSVTALGPREKIALVEVGDTWLVLGMTSQSINTLHSMPKGSLDYDPQAAAAVTFAKLLERIKKPSTKI